MDYQFGRIVDHIHLRVADVDASKRFYRAVLAAVGKPEALVEGKGYFHADELFVDKADGPVSHVHLAFQARDEAMVKAFHRAAIDAGGKDNGAPGERAQYHPGYYGAFVFDPDGNNIEAVFHGEATRSAPSVVVTTHTHRAAGSFVVEMAPLPLADTSASSAFGRMSLHKTFSGDLVATSKGEMLMAGTAVKGSAGYVAIDNVAGTLGGRSGSFALQHTGTMNRGVPALSVTVVPDSGTDQLTGLAGRLSIIIEGSEHRYVFDYSLPDAA